VPSDTIRIRITPREPASGEKNPREAFWLAVGLDRNQHETSARAEAKLSREFGLKLRGALLHELAEPLRTLDSELFPGSLRDFERWMFRYIEGPRSDRESYGYQFAEVFSRVLEQRQQVLRESSSLRRVQERLAEAAGIAFSTRIAGYSSLNLDLSTGSFKQVANAFEKDFDSSRVFLEAFVPVAFAEVFSEESADKLEFAVTIPRSVEQAFLAAAAEAPAPQVTVTPAKPAAIELGAGRERAE